MLIYKISVKETVTAIYEVRADSSYKAVQMARLSAKNRHCRETGKLISVQERKKP